MGFIGLSAFASKARGLGHPANMTVWILFLGNASTDVISIWFGIVGSFAQ